jgi:class 3 adenylate cyclase
MEAPKPGKNGFPNRKLAAHAQQIQNETDPWAFVVRNFERFSRLKDFSNIARSPAVSDVEVIVCFADIRGFTAYCNKLQKNSLDNRIHNFLKQYLEIYGYAVLQEIWELEPIDADKISQQDSAIRDIIIPSTYKNLGDGMMLVWEIPPDCPILIQGLATHHILRIVRFIYNAFDELFHNPGPVETDAFSESVKDLKIGFGLARGHAWKMNFGQNIAPDYAGSVVNLAARLQDMARPEGIVCQYEYSQTLFDNFVSCEIAKEVSLKGLKGFETKKAVFLAKDTLNAWIGAST